MKLTTFFLSFILSLSSAQALKLTPENQYVSQHLLIDALNFYNQDLRDPASGQYFDSISVSPKSVTSLNETNSSVAATGMGLISLALGDALKIVPDAPERTIQTLSTLLKSEYSKRHQSGWFRHWFNASDGSDNGASRGDGFSTIDSAILAAGAVINANYFLNKAKSAPSPLATSGSEYIISELSNKLLLSIDWASSIADFNGGKFFMTYDLDSGAAKGVTSKFNEYVLLSCMGKLAEARRGVTGPMTNFWWKHFSNPHDLPAREYQDSNSGITPLLTDNPLNYLSSFTIQFAYYLCGDINGNNEYVQFFKNAKKVDQLWFAKQSPSLPHYWGSGAGESIGNTYSANSVANNPDLIVSPHIISGFLAEEPALMNDLTEIYNNGNCTYVKNGRELLWRCSIRQPGARMNRIQAVDFSTMIFGLSTLQPGIGNKFFKDFAAGGKK